MVGLLISVGVMIGAGIYIYILHSRLSFSRLVCQSLDDANLKRKKLIAQLRLELTKESFASDLLRNRLQKSEEFRKNSNDSFAEAIRKMDDLVKEKDHKINQLSAVIDVERTELYEAKAKLGKILSLLTGKDSDATLSVHNPVSVHNLAPGETLHAMEAYQELGNENIGTGCTCERA